MLLFFRLRRRYPRQRDTCDAFWMCQAQELLRRHQMLAMILHQPRSRLSVLFILEDSTRLICKAYLIRRQWINHILPSCFDRPVGMMVRSTNIASGVSLIISLLPSTRSKYYQVLSFLLLTPSLTRNQGDLRFQRTSLSISWSKTASEHVVST